MLYTTLFSCCQMDRIRYTVVKWTACTTLSSNNITNYGRSDKHDAKIERFLWYITNTAVGVSRDIYYFIPRQEAILKIYFNGLQCLHWTLRYETFQSILLLFTMLDLIYLDPLAASSESKLPQVNFAVELNTFPLCASKFPISV